MGKKKEPTVDEQIIKFKDVMLRATLSDYYYVDSTIISKNKQGHTLLVSIEQELWNALMNEQFPMKELDINVPEDRELSMLYKYSKLSDDNWIYIGDDVKVFKGESKEIKINGSEYSIIISKEMLPLKLRKIECSNIQYHVFSNPIIVGIKIPFIPTIEGYSFSIIRLFKFV